MEIITAPSLFNKKYTVFLAGTIDCGDSFNWQNEVIKRLAEKNIHNICIFNPRRIDWPEDSDKELIQEQIEWELEMLFESDLIVMNILPNSKSPISLLEMGLYAESGKLKIFCPEDFYRFQNVSVTANFYGIDMSTDNSIDNIVNTIIDSYNKYFNIS